SDVESLAEQELGRPHLVEKNERADHLLADGRQGAANLEATEIAGARNDDLLDCIARVGVAGHGIRRWLPAHRSPPCLAFGNVWGRGVAHLNASSNDTHD